MQKDTTADTWGKEPGNKGREDERTKERRGDKARGRGGDWEIKRRGEKMRR